MPEGRRVVFTRDVNPDRLPEWASEGAILIEWLQQQGFWEKAGERLQVQREGGYCGWDALLFLIYFFTCGLHVGFKEFGERARRHRKQLAAVGGRKTLPSPSSMSRLLSAVRSEDTCAFGPWLLLDAPDVAHVLQHPSVLTRDARGDGWHVFDWDPTITALRHRALPVGEDLPDARRRSAETAQPGYPGRKRGNVQFSRATLQHAGSGLWLGIELAPGNGHVREAFEAAIPLVVSACDKAGSSPDRAVIRCDGVAGNVPFITACHEGHVHYITRFARYGLLEQEEVMSRLREASWYDVPDSGSGPRRQATELGSVMLEPGDNTRRSDGGTYEPIHVRIVASRFETEEERGAGVTVNGWHYELYATDLDPSAWPSSHLVAGYYGRNAQENRFAQEDREFGLDRIFSYDLPGQELATLVALFVWNFHIARGMELANPTRELPEQNLIVPTPIPPALSAEIVDRSESVLEASVTPSSEPAPTPAMPSERVAEVSDEDCTRKQLPQATIVTATDAVDSTSSMSAARDESSLEQAAAELTKSVGSEPPRHEPSSTNALAAAIEQLPWPTVLADKPAWAWDARAIGLRCPAENILPLLRVEQVRGRKPRLRFQAEWGVCDDCSLRQTCLSSTDPSYRKDMRLLIPEEHLESIQRLWDEHQRQHPTPRGRSSKDNVRRAHDVSVSPLRRQPKPIEWRPPTDIASDTTYLSLAAPILLPAALRRQSRSLTSSTEVTVEVMSFPKLSPAPRVLALTDADRQHRRLTWTQRRQWNALPDGAGVTIRFARRDGPIPILSCGDDVTGAAA